jgi:hypothetical protein
MNERRKNESQIQQEYEGKGEDARNQMSVSLRARRSERGENRKTETNKKDQTKATTGTTKNFSTNKNW